MRHWAGVLLVVAIAGCGGDNGDDNGAAITGVEKAKTEATASTGGSVTKSGFHRCIGKTELKLAKKAGPVPGDPETVRANFELEGTEYAGFVVWPSGNIADVWIAPNEDVAKEAQEQYRGVYKQYGKGEEADEFVQRKANVVVALEDEKTPTPEEAETLNSCLEADP